MVNLLKRQVRLIASIAISVVFLAVAARNLAGDAGSVVAALRQANYWFLLPALVAYFVGVWLRAARWHFLLRPVKPIAVGRLFPVVVIGYMANDVLPARLGEVVRAYVLGEQERVPKTTTLATILVERMFDGLVMLAFVALVTLVVPLDANIQQVIRLAAALFLGALVVVFVVVSSRARAVALVGRLEQLLPAGLEGRIAPVADRFIQGMNSLQSPRLALAVAALSVGAWLCEATMYLIVALGFDLRLGYPAFILTTALANLMAMVPAAPGYVGTFDAGALAGLVLFGVARAQATGYVAVLHLALWAPVSLLGFYYLWRANLSLRTLGRRAADEEKSSTEDNIPEGARPATIATTKGGSR